MPPTLNMGGHMPITTHLIAGPEAMMEKRARLFKTFRARLMLLLTSFLLITIILVLVLDRWAQKRAADEVERQSQQIKEAFNTSFGDFAQALGLAVQSLSSEYYLYKTIAPDQMPSTVKHIIVTDESGKVTDSTLRDLIGQIITVPERPETVGVMRDIDPVVGEVEIHGGLIKTYNIPVLTTKGLHWIVIVMQQEAVINQIDTASVTLASRNRRLSNYRLVATAGLLALALAIVVWIGWRFTRPIQELVAASRRVAAGDLDFRVHIERADEVGQLAFTFNEMIAGLKLKQDLEERLNQSERAAAIGRLTQAIAHEIRNPLNVLNLSMDHLSAKFAPADEARGARFAQIISTIKSEISRLKHMVSDVLAFGRPVGLTVELIDVRRLVEDAFAFILPQADAQGVEVAVEAEETPIGVRGDVERLKSCLSNITINALQAMPAGGLLTARVRRSDGLVEIRISDTGVGISEESLGKIFDPYFSTKQSGFGLGLALTKRIIQEHQGSIEVSSRVGLGTTFVVRLPAADGTL